MRVIEIAERQLSVLTHSECPELEAAVQADDFLRQWPQFMFHDPYAAEHYPTMYERCPEFQFYVQDDGGVVVAGGNSIPLAWDGTAADLPQGWDAGLERGALGARNDVEPNALCALQATASGAYVGQGLGAALVQTMRMLAMEAGFDALIAPVRPSGKERYPLTEIERYVNWRRQDGLLLDPWLRVHERAGASIMRTAPESMTISGTVAEWEEWTGLRFPDSGEYVVPRALVPVTVDVDDDRCVYVEPNVWMVHRWEASA